MKMYVVVPPMINLMRQANKLCWKDFSKPTPLPPPPHSFSSKTEVKPTTVMDSEAPNEIDVLL